MWAINWKRRNATPPGVDPSAHGDAGTPLVNLAVSSRLGDSMAPVAPSRAECDRCGQPVDDDARVCPRCLASEQRSRAFFRFRVGVLLSVLAGVLVWAGRDIHRRHARTLWTEPLDVALVLLCKAPVDPAAVRALHERKAVLEDRLSDELRRYGGTLQRPFRFTIYNAAAAPALPPAQPSDGVWELVRYNFELWRFARTVNASVHLDASAVDATIYLVASPPKVALQSTIEGASQEGGTVGVVAVELDRSMVDFALFVATHELLHTLGASDKYDGDGRSLVPDGLPEPERLPLYPQRFAEVMARNVALAPLAERPPESLDELKIGRATAREIKWLR